MSNKKNGPEPTLIGTEPKPTPNTEVLIMENSINEIVQLINRAENAQRVTDKLAEESSLFARWVVARMEELGIKRLDVNGYVLRIVKYNASAGSTWGLVANTELTSDEYAASTGDFGENTIAGDGGYYYAGDFNAWIQYPSREEVLTFIGQAEGTVCSLAKLVDETEKVTVPETV